MSLQEQFSPGTRVQGRYVIQRLLGVGGFAAVFEAHDEQMDRLVALKILNLPTFPNEDARARFLERFEREAKLAARVDHPNCINVFDYGTCEQPVLPFIVMERLDGEDLGDYLEAHGPMAPGRLLPLFIQALHALGFAHEQGIVHKDLKPSNLFVKYPGTRRESLCLVDFGIAHLQDVTTRLTQTGNVVGTPHYVAPEYITEQLITPALDVYQMGLILVESLQGKQVVQASDSLVAMFQHVNGNLTAPARLMQTPLGPVLQKALAWSPADRYPDAFAFADALEAIDPAALPTLGPDEPQIELRSTESREQIAQAIARVTGPTPATPAASTLATPAETPAPAPPPDEAPRRARVDSAPTVQRAADPPQRTSPWRAILMTLVVGAALFFGAAGLIAIAAMMVEQEPPRADADQGRVDVIHTTPDMSAVAAAPDMAAASAEATTAGQRTAAQVIARAEALSIALKPAPRVGIRKPDGRIAALKLPVKPRTKPKPKPKPKPRPTVKLSAADMAMRQMLAQQAIMRKDMGSALRECELPSKQGYRPCHDIVIRAAITRGDNARACAATSRAMRDIPARTNVYTKIRAKLGCQ